MKTVLIVIGILACIVTGVVILKTLQYYSGSDISREIEAMRGEKKSSLKREKKRRSLKRRKETLPSEKRTRRKEIHPIDLNKFYGSIELSDFQKEYAKSVVATLEEQYTRFRQELSTLRKETEQKLLGCVDKTKQRSLSASVVRNLPLDKVYKEFIIPNLDPEKERRLSQYISNFLRDGKRLNRNNVKPKNSQPNYLSRFSRQNKNKSFVVNIRVRNLL
ncbi:hypothetical protein J7M23_08105 [Candidatus Sumerlaeota bacterium]|nr:hypothetical protein [Candidatus Sumerlaeota bacterium]